MKWMNESTIDELKAIRLTLHRIALILAILLTASMITTAISYELNLLLLFFITGGLTLISILLFGLYIIKRDIYSVIIYLKEHEN